MWSVCHRWWLCPQLSRHSWPIWYMAVQSWVLHIPCQGCTSVLETQTLFTTEPVSGGGIPLFNGIVSLSDWKISDLLHGSIYRDETYSGYFSIQYKVNRKIYKIKVTLQIYGIQMIFTRRLLMNCPLGWCSPEVAISVFSSVYLFVCPNHHWRKKI